ncbi:MAG: hypothetical protein ABFD08_00440 [Syntrophomonas sp.]
MEYMGKYDEKLKIFWKIWWVGLVILAAIVLIQNYFQVKEKLKNSQPSSQKTSISITSYIQGDNHKMTI